MKKKDGTQQFYHYASSVKPARVIFTDSKPEIELDYNQVNFGENLKFMKVTKITNQISII